MDITSSSSDILEMRFELILRPISTEADSSLRYGTNFQRNCIQQTGVIMNTKLHQLRDLGLVLVALLTACSGSGNVNISADGPNFPPMPPPIPAPVTEDVSAFGVISALNSVTVNGVRYGTDATTVTVNGRLASVSDLKLGQLVSLEGTIEVDRSSGTAHRIDYEPTVVGPVENIDAALGQLIVMGQTVRADADTVFDSSIDPNTFAGITVGSNAQISGFLNASGEFVATRIEPDNASTSLQVIGSVAGLDLANMLFAINRLTVDYSSAVMIDLPGGAPANGMLVMVRGSLANGILVVDEILSLYDGDATVGERIQVSGLITRFQSPNDFSINGFPAFTNANTGFVNGAIDDLAANAQVTIDGKIAASGDAVRAKTITFGSIVDPTTTVTFDFTNFSEISVPTVFKVTVVQGSEFLVQATVDSDIVNRIDITQTGARLNIALLQGQGDNNIETLEALVTMPVLDRIDLTGVVNATVQDFNQSQMTVNVGGVSRLEGSALTIGNLTANVSGVSQLNLGNIRPLTSANIDISGVSLATLNMDTGSMLTGSVSTGQGTGTSTLFYYGTNVSINVATGPLSSVVKLGETRP
jgi:hypothetical protein